MGCTGKDALLGLNLSKMSPVEQPDGQSSFSRATEIFKDIAEKGKTGYSLDGVQTNFILEKGFDVIRKPFTLISLGKKIREILHGRKQGDGTQSRDSDS